MRITAIAGCTHNTDLVHRLARAAADVPDAHLTVLAGTADGVTLNGLRRCPDLDACCETVAAAHGHQPAGPQTTAVQAELARFGVAATWLPASDADFARDILRTHLLHLGYPLTHVTAALLARFDLPTQVLPVTDDAIELHAVVEDTEHPGGSQAVHLDRWQRMEPQPPALRFVTVGIDRAAPTEEALAAIAGADLVIWLPSSPVAVLAPIVHLPELAAAVTESGAPVVGVSPFVPGFPGQVAAAGQLAAAGFDATEASCWRPLAEGLTHWVCADVAAAALPPTVTGIPLGQAVPSAGSGAWADPVVAAALRVADQTVPGASSVAAQAAADPAPTAS